MVRDRATACRFHLARYKLIKIQYYSGTGCTALAAESLYAAFLNAGCGGKSCRIFAGEKIENAEDLLILMFPLHSFNAPEPVYKWIENLAPADKMPAAVIDVSGGGSVCPNRAGRVSSIKRLEKKGYDVVYEDSIVMPSNFVTPTNDKLSAMLLEALPVKTEQIAGGILSGERRRIKPPLLDRLASKLGELEKVSAKSFGKGLAVSVECDGCGWCAENCPAGNISMEPSKPVFADKCHLCLCCVYGCPKNALFPKKYKFAVLKDGFSLARIEAMTPLSEPAAIDELAKGFLWSGVKKYLKEMNPNY